jgi:hypothetical protein
MSEKVETTLETFEWKILRRLYGAAQKMLNGESTIILKSVFHMRV